MQRAGQQLGQPQPERPEQQHHAEGDADRDHNGAGLVLAEVEQHLLHLHADQQEDHALQQEVDQAPDGGGLQAAGAGRILRGVVPDDQTGDHDRQHAGQVEVLGQHIRAHRGDQRDRVGGQRVGAQHPQEPDGVGDRHADDHATDRDEQELPRGVGHRELDGRLGRDVLGDQQDGQRGGVVEQALTLDQGDQPGRQARLAADGQRGDRIGRGHRGAQGDTGRQADTRHRDREPEADQERGDDHQGHGEADHRAQIAPDVEQGRVQRRVVEQRRKDERENQVRVDLKISAGQIGVDDSGDGQQDGGGQAGLPGDPVDHHDDRDGPQTEKKGLLVAHLPILRYLRSRRRGRRMT